jgi:hypothetical protein
MNRKQTMTFAAAALSGMLAGSAARAAAPVFSHSASGRQMSSTVGLRAVAMDNPTHDCAGKNACKGQGGCNSGDNGCKGKNSCKGKGGCKTSPTTAPALGVLV